MAAEYKSEAERLQQLQNEKSKLEREEQELNAKRNRAKSALDKQYNRLLDDPDIDLVSFQKEYQDAWAQVKDNQSASLDGTVSDDGLPNNTLTVTWSQVSGPGTANFANANAVDTTATFTAAGAYTLRLTASDGSLTANDTMSVTVNSTGGTEERIAFDNIESASGGGGTGWSSVWTGSGDVRLTTSGRPRGSWHIRMRRTGMAQRSVNLSGVSNAKLVFYTRLFSFERSDRATVQLSTNGGSSFTTIRTFVNGDDNGVHTRYEIPLNTSSSNVVIRFDGDMSGSRDYYYIDDIEVRGVR